MTSARSRRGGLARESGRRGEVLAALLLMLKGCHLMLLSMIYRLD